MESSHVGAYKTDGINLCRVVPAASALGQSGTVVLEDCLTLQTLSCTVEAFCSLELAPVMPEARAMELQR